MATRAAVGASRAQIVRQLLAECAAIALLALPLGMLVTRACLDYFLSLVPSTISYMDQIFRFDGNVFAFAIAVTLATVLVFGLLPALKASKVDLSTSLKEGGDRGGTDSGSQRARASLVVVQIGLALSLLVAASLFMQAFAKITHADPGFRMQGVMAAGFVLPESRYGNAEKLRSFQRELAGALNTLPGNAHAAVASDAPLDWGGPFRDFQIVGHETAAREDEPRARWSSISPDYFSVLGVSMVKGRSFTSADGPDSQPVAVITRSFADKFFHGQNPMASA